MTRSNKSKTTWNKRKFIDEFFYTHAFGRNCSTYSKKHFINLKFLNRKLTSSLALVPMIPGDDVTLFTPDSPDYIGACHAIRFRGKLQGPARCTRMISTEYFDFLSMNLHLNFGKSGKIWLTRTYILKYGSCCCSESHFDEFPGFRIEIFLGRILQRSFQWWKYVML